MKNNFRFSVSIVTMLSALLLAGCISSKQLDITSYNLTAPSVGKVVKESRFGNLFVHDFYVNPAYEDKNFTYQTGDLTYESDFYNQLKLSPRAQFTTLTRTTLSESGLFKTVIMPESQQPPEYALEGSVSKFYVDFRDSKNPKANLNIAFRFYYIPRNGHEYQVLLAKTYEESISVPRNSANAIAHAWNTAYNNIMRQLIGNLGKVQLPTEKPDSTSTIPNKTSSSTN